jgi:(2R)-ethylmalonyl-CoA mutase
MKTQLVESHRERVAAIERGELKVVGQNVYTSTELSPLRGGEDGGILVVDEGVEASAVAALGAWREQRDQEAVDRALSALAEAARDESVNIMPASIDAARAGVTTGEWAAALREAFGEYRAPTGVADASAAPGDDALAELRDKVERVSESLGRRVKILVGKPGLDGHSNGAEQVAVRARDAGFDVVYEGIRLTPSQIAKSALDEGVHVVGLSILSGSHMELIPDVIHELEAVGVDVPLVVGGIIPAADEKKLLDAGVARVYTPKDFQVTQMMSDIVDLVAERHGAAAAA